MLTIAAMVAAAPIVGVILVSLNPPGAAVGGVGLPNHPSLSNISQTWQQGDFGGALAWSAVLTAGTVIIATLCAVPAGYGFATMRFRGRAPLFYLFVLGMILPYASVLIPMYYEFRFLSLSGTPWAVILPSAALSISFGTFWMRAVFLSLPRELIEAARIDGASSFSVLLRVGLPIVRSAILVLVLLLFLWTWNAFMLPLIMLAGSSIITAPLDLNAFQGGHVSDVPGLAAGALFVSFPVVALYVLTQRYFVRGLTEGALKL
ncbi:MAG: carbohydrate ABC transporter permease [Acidimicrobiales bacterium]